MMNGEEVFSIHHSVLHWAHQCSTGSYKCLFIWWFVCVIWKQNTILIRNNIVLNVKFHFAGELRGFAHCVCVFWFVCRVLRIWGMLSENVCKQSRKTVIHLQAVPSIYCSQRGFYMYPHLNTFPMARGGLTAPYWWNIQTDTEGQIWQPLPGYGWFHAQNINMGQQFRGIEQYSPMVSSQCDFLVFKG